MSQPLATNAGWQGSIGDCASLACLWEAMPPKAGNVHRGADFADMSFTDFAVSAVAIRPTFERAADCSVGQLVLEAVTATRRLVPVNTNLGLLLLLAPLAKAAVGGSPRDRLPGVLRGLTSDDARLVYEAIRLAAPGGLGKSRELDIADAPPENLLDAMRAAAERDLIAQQYVSDFRDVFELVTDRLVEATRRQLSLSEAIVDTHLRLMAERPDSLIARKCGPAVADRSAALAGGVLAAGEAFSADYLAALSDFDFWLRSDGNRRNPGTSADMLGAGLFVALWEGSIAPPFR